MAGAAAYEGTGRFSLRSRCLAGEGRWHHMVVDRRLLVGPSVRLLLLLLTLASSVTRLEEPPSPCPSTATSRDSSKSTTTCTDAPRMVMGARPRPATGLARALVPCSARGPAVYLMDGHTPSQPPCGGRQHGGRGRGGEPRASPWSVSASDCRCPRRLTSPAGRPGSPHEMASPSTTTRQRSPPPTTRTRRRCGRGRAGGKSKRRRKSV